MGAHASAGASERRRWAVLAGVSLALGAVGLLGVLEPAVGIAFGGAAVVAALFAWRRGRASRAVAIVAASGFALGAYSFGVSLAAGVLSVPEAGLVESLTVSTQTFVTSPATTSVPTTTTAPRTTTLTGPTPPPPPPPPHSTFPGTDGDFPPPPPETSPPPPETITRTVTQLVPASDEDTTSLEQASWVVTIMGPFFGALGAFGGAWLTRRDRQSSEGFSSRREAAGVVVPVQTLLLEADPARFTQAASAPRAVAELQARWRDELRDPLLVFGASHPSRGIGARGRDARRSRAVRRRSGGAARPAPTRGACAHGRSQLGGGDPQAGSKRTEAVDLPRLAASVAVSTRPTERRPTPCQGAPAPCPPARCR
jgi:hypothetical protein